MSKKYQGIVISAPEEIAYINGFIDKEKLMESAKAYGKSPYGEHLKAVAEGKEVLASLVLMTISASKEQS